MNDQHEHNPEPGSTPARLPDSDDQEALTFDTFSEALLDAVLGHPTSAELNDDERHLIAAIRKWAPGLPEALANLEDDDQTGPTPVRADDPVAQMLGLVQDPAVRLDGGRLTSARKSAGLKIDDLASRLQQRGWDVSVSTAFAWERETLNPPPATINAIAEVLTVAPYAILATNATQTQTLDVLFDDELIAAFLQEWSQEVNVPAETLAEHSKRLLATAGKRNATSATPQTLLAILKHFKNLPGFESTE